uniref:Keratin n=1 Tax=Labrus bergylta TaxID=56723 RepID=A0A3Q3EM26_9LABR
MMVMLLVGLLIGSTTCGPVEKGKTIFTCPDNEFSLACFCSGSGSNNAVPNNSSLPSQYDPNPEVAAVNPGRYVGYGSEVYTVPEVAAYGVPYASYQPEGSYGSVSAPRDENWNSGSATDYGASVGAPQPVFSDVSDLEPVYSFSSRSRYQRGRATFVQIHYSPGDPVIPPMPVYKPLMKPVPEQSSPPQAPPKGGD